jgi:hypothetical protein
MSTPDVYVAELVCLADHYEKAAAHFERHRITEKCAPITDLYLRRAAAIRWVLSLTAYPLDGSEAV